MLMIHVLQASHVLNVFSFSKAFGMMGWRVGYVAYPPELALPRERLLSNRHRLQPLQVCQ
mgnify:CR=1 FL=1